MFLDEEKMIVGLGVDITNISRIDKILNKFGKRFKNRVFTKAENENASLRKNSTGYYANRWAVKEACFKALGCGMDSGIGWKDIETNNSSSGRPQLTVSGAAKTRLKEIIPDGYSSKINLSISDDHPFAQAVVIIEALPRNC